MEGEKQGDTKWERVRIHGRGRRRGSGGGSRERTHERNTEEEVGGGQVRQGDQAEKRKIRDTRKDHTNIHRE